LLTALCVILPASPVYALVASQTQVFQRGVYLYDSEINAGCVTGVDAASANLTGNGHLEQAYNFFTATHGLTPFVASAIIGTMMEESGKGLNTQALNPSSGAFGIAQWLGGRLDRLHASAGANVNDFSVQLNFVWTELSGGYASTLSTLKSQTDINKAVYDFEDTYEGSGHAAIPGRQADAKFILATYGKNAPAVPTGTPPATTPTSTSSCSSAPSGPVTSADCKATAPAWVGEYSLSQFASIFGDPGTAASHPAIDAKLVSVDFLGKTVQVHSLAAGCLKAVAAEITAKNINYKIKLMGCYRYDSNNGSSNIGLHSYHTYGIACDINPGQNPFVASGATAPHDMPDGYVQAFRNHGFTWGGSWPSPKDYMHFEFNGIKP